MAASCQQAAVSATSGPRSLEDGADTRRPDWRIELVVTLRAMADPKKHTSAADLLADWRSAGRDTAAAHAAEKVAEMALIAAAHAEEAADEVAIAAAAALEAVDRAQIAANRARAAALQAGEAAHLALSAAEGDRVRASEDAQDAEAAEAEAQERYRGASEKGFPG